MNLAIKLFRDCPERDEYKQGIHPDWIAKVIENCDIAPDSTYQIMTSEQYQAYKAEKEHLVTEWIEKQKDLANLPTYKEKRLNEKVTVTTSYGEFSLDTPVGSLSSIITGLMVANLPIYSNILRFQNGEWLQDLTNEQFKGLFSEIYIGLQLRDRFCGAVNNSKTVEELNSIIIDY